MGDPLASRIGTLKFAQLHSPKMKSIYWRYFGFPTFENGKIITKQNVVCTMCHRVLTNHGNTTNLRAHLQHRHKDVFSAMMEENNLKVPQRKVNPPKDNENNSRTRTVKREAKLNSSPGGRIKIEYLDMEEEESSNIPEEGQNTMLYESMVPMTYEDDENIDSEGFSKVEIGREISNTDNNRLNDEMKTLISNENDGEILQDHIINRNEEATQMSGGFRVQYVADNTFKQFQLQDSLINLVITDLQTLDSLYDSGMNQLMRLFVAPNLEIIPREKLETSIQEMYSDKLTEISTHIKTHSQSNPFSLSFENWQNVERKNFLTVYYNYTTSPLETGIINQLYSTFEYHKYSNIETVFQDFNLENCSAVIVNYDLDDYLTDFFKSRNIPVMVSFDVIIDKCLRETLMLPSVASIIHEVNDTILRFQVEMASKAIDIPAYIEEFPWTCYELLKFFSETVSWPDDVEPLVKSAKLIVDTYNTLNITLETLRGEEAPFCSLISPFVARILNKQYVVSDKDEDIVKEIKTTIAELLRKFVLEDDNFTIAALLDPRFHRLINIDNFNRCLQTLIEKSNKISSLSNSSAQVKTKTSTSVKLSASNAGNKSNANNPNKKSNLEIFFDLSEQPSSSPENAKSNIEQDLQRYRKDVHVTLDESPIVWWQHMGYIYNSLKQIAPLYQCIPCVVNMRYQKTFREQINFQHKRFMLTGNLLDAILFLSNYNENHALKIK